MVQQHIQPTELIMKLLKELLLAIARSEPGRTTPSTSGRPTTACSLSLIRQCSKVLSLNSPNSPSYYVYSSNTQVLLRNDNNRSLLNRRQRNRNQAGITITICGYQGLPSIHRKIQLDHGQEALDEGPTLRSSRRDLRHLTRF